MATSKGDVGSPGGMVRSGRRKKEVFYSVIWPALLEQGWTKIEGSERIDESDKMNAKPIFVPKVLELKLELEPGEDFYDDELLVIDRLLERRNEIESAIADRYLAKAGMHSGGATPKGKGKAPRASDASADDQCPKEDTEIVAAETDEGRLMGHAGSHCEEKVADAVNARGDLDCEQPAKEENLGGENPEESSDVRAQSVNSTCPDEEQIMANNDDNEEVVGEEKAVGPDEDSSDDLWGSNDKDEEVEDVNDVGADEESSDDMWGDNDEDVGMEEVKLGDKAEVEQSNGKSERNEQQRHIEVEDETEHSKDADFQTDQVTPGNIKAEGTSVDDRHSEQEPTQRHDHAIEEEPSETTEHMAESETENQDEDAVAEPAEQPDKTATASRRSKRKTRKRKGSEGSMTRGNARLKDADGRPRPVYDFGDRDGSDYHSSDESKEGRKRKRKAPTQAPASPSARGRGRGRPRGRPKGTGRPRGRPRKDGSQPSPKRGLTPPGRKKGSSSRRHSTGTAMLDLSWKNGGKNFPKKVSQVGPDFNATEIEEAGIWKMGDSEIYCEQIWDPKVAEDRLNGESTDFLESKQIPYNRREGAMIGLAEAGYDSQKFEDDKVVEKISARDGTEWSEEERERYHLEIFRARKDIREVARVTGKSINSCLAYYLGTFKKSDDYRLLKTVRYEERLRRMLENDHDMDACKICGDGGNLLICDGCECEYHMECMRPALQSIPEGTWKCDECVDRAFLAAKDSLIRKTKLFARAKDHKGEEPSCKEESAEGSGTFLMRPTSPALDIVKKLATNISAAFSDGNV